MSGRPRASPVFAAKNGVFGTGVAVRPFEWYLDINLKMALVGVAQDPTTLVLSAPLDWALVHTDRGPLISGSGDCRG